MLKKSTENLMGIKQNRKGMRSHMKRSQYGTCLRKGEVDCTFKIKYRLITKIIERSIDGNTKRKKPRDS